MKLANFMRLDPYHIKRGVKGLSNGSNAEKIIWNEFLDLDTLVTEVSKIYTSGKKSKKSASQAIHQSKYIIYKGETETSQIKKIRLKQHFFRKKILANYISACCICGLSIDKLLFASHIIPWSINKNTRLSEDNGLCLCAIHDKAFDRGFITINENYEVVLSQVIKKENNLVIKNMFIIYEGNKIYLPEKYPPKQEFLVYHRENIFLG